MVRGDEARLGDRGPGRRDRRQLRADPGRRDGRGATASPSSGRCNLAATMPFHASQMYGRNVLTLLQHLSTKEAAPPTLDPADEITGAHAGGPRREGALTMERRASSRLYVFVLAGFVGFLVITKVPPLLHTPLMSATNAISGISLVGSLVLAGADHGTGVDRPRLHRRDLRHDQRGRRLHHHRPHAQDVQARRPAEGSRRSDRRASSSSRRPTSPPRSSSSSASRPHHPRQGPPRHAAGRARHAGGHRRHAGQPRDRHLRVDPGRPGARHRHRLAARHSRCR